jgi:hypothetical protein
MRSAHRNPQNALPRSGAGGAPALQVSPCCLSCTRVSYEQELPAALPGCGCAARAAIHKTRYRAPSTVFVPALDA